jgi:hypothetical protein
VVSIQAVRKELVDVAQSEGVEIPPAEMAKAASASSVRSVMKAISQYDPRFMYKHSETATTAETICSVVDESVTNREGTLSVWATCRNNFAADSSVV